MDRQMERVKEINEISTILEKSREDLYHVLSKIGWDKEGLKNDMKNICPVNSGHTIPSSSLDSHVEKCRLEKEGIDPKDVCPSSHFFYKNSLAVVPVLIDKKKYESFKSEKKELEKDIKSVKGENKPWECIPSDLDDVVEDTPTSSNLTKPSNTHQYFKQKAVETITTKTPGIKSNKEKTVTVSLQEAQRTPDFPLPMSKVQFDLSPTQRVAVYDYVVQTAKAIKRRAAEDELEDLQKLAEKNEDSEEKEDTKAPKSHLDALAEMRDYKRRRQSYRAKNVHMTKRTNVEVMRDLIDTQMKMLEEMNRENQNLKNEGDNDEKGPRKRDVERHNEKGSTKKERSIDEDKYRERRKDERHRP